MRTLTILLLGATASLGCAPERTPSPSQSSLSIDQLLEIRHPSRPTWSPDGSRLAFIWDAAGVQNVYVVGAGEMPEPEALTSYSSGVIDDAPAGTAPIYWDSNDTVSVARSGVLWRLPADGSGEPVAIWEGDTAASTEALSLGLVGSGFSPSPDGNHVAFVIDGDIWVRNLRAGENTRLTRTPAVESDPIWSPDGSRLVVTVTESVRHDEAYDYVGAKMLFSRLEGWSSDVAVIPAAGGRATLLAATPGSEFAPQWLDDSRISLQRVSEDQTTREILTVRLSDGQEQILHRDVDEKWWSLGYLGADPRPSPDGRWIAFLSDREGWNHIYLVSSDKSQSGDGADLIQLTEGSHEYGDLAWSPDGRRLAFSLNSTDGPGIRHLAVAEIGHDPSASSITTLTSGGGTNTAPSWSPDGRHIVFQHTDPESSADLFIIETAAGSEPRRLTDSMPANLDRSALIEPEFVRYPAEDGSEVPAYLFVPPELDRSQQHPAVVWVHGDGINQNYDGWHIQRNYAVYYSFHQYLAQRGYVVLSVDYRGSIGYGKQWRQGHFRDLGGKDYLDVAAGMDYLETLGYVDTKRVGVWGLSYGGFMTLQALTVTPDLFRCGINVAGVADWRTWHKDPGGPWIQGRMGTPAENVELYQRTASIEFIDRIERPLLVLHGTADVNVPFTESVRLVDALTKRGKDYEFVMYPGEFHYFHRAHILRDAWTRVESFFDEHLR